MNYGQWQFLELLINDSRNEIKEHLLSINGHEFKSGYLTETDIKDIELITGSMVHCSTDSGEYFYKLA